MRSLTWRPEARRLLLEMTHYIGQRNATAAIRLEAAILQKTALLPKIPHMGRPGRIEGTRELIIHPNYLVIYDVGETEVRILRILHARQQYP